MKTAAAQNKNEMNEENFNCVGCADETIEAAMKIALVITQSKRDSK